MICWERVKTEICKVYKVGCGLRRCNFSDKFLYLNSVFEFEFYLNFSLNCICSSSYSALSDQLSADSVGLARPPLFIKLCVLSIWICDQTFWTAFSKLLLMLCGQLRAETLLLGKGAPSCYERRPWGLPGPHAHTRARAHTLLILLPLTPTLLCVAFPRGFWA